MFKIKKAKHFIIKKNNSLVVFLEKYVKILIFSLLFFNLSMYFFFYRH